MKANTDFLNDIEAYDFFRRARFKSALDAWQHAEATLPIGLFVQVFLNDKLISCGYTGTKRKILTYGKKKMD